ncbi:hypothetical protein [Pseudoruegeria sp. SHC-113]|uniref:hypothetical protein n=1 Tax=Pseudoruegeria sp. SHC-113 TaxID=2855439 RepID=UPI0021BA7C1D|nr:hypothetical protein [Pseudoruegeria sp. SHC-113]MCT8159585.1 hypothetical protein [Pseudoruegeria sp. SHC-113]
MASRILLIDLAGGPLHALRGVLAAGNHNVVELPARWRIAECGKDSGADIVVARVAAGTDLRKILVGAKPTGAGQPSLSPRASEAPPAPQATPSTLPQGSGQMPAVLLVGPSDAARRGKALDMGAEDWIAEDASPGYLLDRINNISRRRAGLTVPPPLQAGLREPERAFAGKAVFWISPGPAGATHDMITRLAAHAGALSTAHAPAERSLAIVMDGPGWRVPASAAFVFVTRQPFGEAARFALRCGALDVIDGACGEQEVLLRLRRAWERHRLTGASTGPQVMPGGTAPPDAPWLSVSGV